MKNVLFFIAGIGVGVITTSIYCKNKYEAIMQEEVEELRNMNNKEEKVADPSEGCITKDKLNNETKSQKEMWEQSMEAKDKEIANKIINYSGYSKTESNEETKEINSLSFITPDEFASLVGYDTDSFYIYEDNVIVNENNEVISDVKETFGFTTEEIRVQFDENQSNSVYIRNNKLKTDYEILIDLSKYYEGNGD